MSDVMTDREIELHEKWGELVVAKTVAQARLDLAIRRRPDCVESLAVAYANALVAADRAALELQREVARARAVEDASASARAMSIELRSFNVEGGR